MTAIDFRGDYKTFSVIIVDHIKETEITAIG